jgi:hypothetical protein
MVHSMLGMERILVFPDDEAIIDTYIIVFMDDIYSYSTRQ